MRPIVLATPARRVTTAIQVIFCLVVLIAASIAQSNPAAGIQPFSTQLPGGLYEAVNPATSNIYVHVPVRTKPGKIPVSLAAVMNSHAEAVLSNDAEFWNVSPATYGYMSYVTPFSTTAAASSESQVYACTASENGGPVKKQYANKISGFYVTDPTGAQHSMGAAFYYSTWPSACGTNPVPYATGGTADGSGYSLIYPGSESRFNIYDRSGTEMVFANGTVDPNVVDADGSTLSWTSSGLIDSLGSQFITGSSVTCGQLTCELLQYTDAAGNTQSVEVNYSYYTQQTAFGCSSINDVGPTPNTVLPSSITTPDGTIYFSYETTPNDTHTPHYTTGRLAGITYPTGASVSYSYSGGYNGIYCVYSSSIPNVVPTLTKTINDGSGNLSSWVYTNSNSSDSQNFTVTVTDPAQNQTVYSFSGQYQTQAQYWQGAVGTTLLKTVVTCYSSSGSSESACVAGSFSSNVVNQTYVYTYPGSSTNPSLVATNFDTHGNVISVAKYDFGAVYPPSANTNPVSTTTTTYDYPPEGSNSYPCGALAVEYMWDRPCTITTTNSGGVTVSQTSYTYNSAGHAITTSQWVSGSGTSASYLANSASYNTNGTPNVLTDINGTTTTTYSYSGVCNSLEPTGVSISGTAVSLSGSMSWDCNGGVQTSITDPNRNTTTTSFTNSSGTTADPYYRPLSVVDPLSNTTAFTYTTTTLESTMNFNGSTSTADGLTTTDGLGRRIFSQTRQAPASTSFDSTQTVYGWQLSKGGCSTSSSTKNPFTTGACTTQSMPYNGTAGTAAPAGTSVTTTYYDAIGRPSTVVDGGGGTTSYQYVQNDVLVTVGTNQTFQKQLEYDGLGRLTSVCEITAASGSGTCGQINTKQGYWTRYQYDALGNLTGVCQNTTTPLSMNCVTSPSASQQTRTYTYDGLSRLTSESNPESGTVTYIYDYYPSGAPCGNAYNFPGQLVLKRLANGNFGCYDYDGLGRLTDISAGYSGQGTTLCRRFRYDNSTGVVGLPGGVSPQNPYGRMVEAETDDCVQPITSVLTDEWFSYDADGRQTGFWESTPNSGGYYNTNATYFANGALNTFGGVPGLYSWTFNVDGEGRPYSANNDTPSPDIGVICGNCPPPPPQPVASTTYYPTQSQTLVTFGNGNTDTYGYDSTTGRMNSFQFSVGSTTLAGSLGWNSNWTLGTLGLTDGFNSSNTQNCGYTYDNLARINSVTCKQGSTTVWYQNFTIDPFGNVSKSGTSSFDASYLPNNQEQSVGGCTPGYDANGDMTSDCTYIPAATYVWNVYGNPTTLNGVNITYDALGREAEISSGSGITQILYSPIGKIGTMNGQTANTIRIPLPGGSIAELLGNSGDERILHSDWLGSSRLSTYYAGTLAYDAAYAPYGESYVPSGSANSDLNFTGQSQDTTSGLYDFLYREYNPVQGRWISPDPAGLAAADPTNPQSWNRYAYAFNSPVVFTDLAGLSVGEGFIPCGNTSMNFDAPCDPHLGGANCMVDGAPTPCDMISWNSEAFAMCSQPGCEGLRVDPVTGQWQTYHPPIYGTYTDPNGTDVIWVVTGGWSNFVTNPLLGGMETGDTIGPGPPPQPALKPSCSPFSSANLWAGVKAAAADFVGEPTPGDSDLTPTDPRSLLANKTRQALAIGVLYQTAIIAGKIVPKLALAADAAAGAVPVIGQLWLGYQVGKALWKGGQAIKQSIDRCYNGG